MTKDDALKTFLTTFCERGMQSGERIGYLSRFYDMVHAQAFNEGFAMGATQASRNTAAAFEMVSDAFARGRGIHER